MSYLPMLFVITIIMVIPTVLVIAYQIKKAKRDGDGEKIKLICDAIAKETIRYLLIFFVFVSSVLIILFSK